MDLLLSLHCAFSMVIQFETQNGLELDNVEDISVSINVVDAKKSYERKPPECTLCGRIGHIVKTCYRKHNFSPRFKKETSFINNIVTDSTDLTYDKIFADKSTINQHLSTFNTYH
ncbi:hypothetical protein CR513_18471, partial [Mucuna pruriens]